MSYPIFWCNKLWALFFNVRIFLIMFELKIYEIQWWYYQSINCHGFPSQQVKAAAIDRNNNNKFKKAPISICPSSFRGCPLLSTQLGLTWWERLSCLSEGLVAAGCETCCRPCQGNSLIWHYWSHSQMRFKINIVKPFSWIVIYIVRYASLQI